MKFIVLLAIFLMSPLPFAAGQNAELAPAALAAKTVAVLNDTHAHGVEEGAEAELKEWGRLKVVDDLDSADLVLHFSKKSERETSHTNKTDANGNPTDYGFTITSESKVYMTVTMKDGFDSFYKTETTEGKQKAGRVCVQSFIRAWQNTKQK